MQQFFGFRFTGSIIARLKPNPISHDAISCAMMAADGGTTSN
jgi:hypothetical protein